MSVLMGQLTIHLIGYKQRTIGLEELEQFANRFAKDYSVFAEAVLALETNGVLEMIKKNGRTRRVPSIAYRYRIKRDLLLKDHFQEIQRYELSLHPEIILENYYSLSREQWEMDLPYIQMLDQYLMKVGIPEDMVPAPERSYEIASNEKWITDLAGRELLERVRLWEKMKIVPIDDPLMFAVNPNQIGSSQHKHLIVENKTTYEGLVPVLTDTSFTTLIYGVGKKIIKSIEHFHRQLPLPHADHEFYYFGDLDHTGIQIWHSLQRKIIANPALPFYMACLQKEAVLGKEYQREDEESLRSFIAFFPKEEQSRIVQMLEHERYCPQEMLKSRELQHIWRESVWKSIN